MKTLNILIKTMYYGIFPEQDVISDMSQAIMANGLVKQFHWVVVCERLKLAMSPGQLALLLSSVFYTSYVQR